MASGIHATWVCFAALGPGGGQSLGSRAHLLSGQVSGPFGSQVPQGLRLFSLAPYVVLLWDPAEFVQQAATMILRDPRKVLL